MTRGEPQDSSREEEKPVGRAELLRFTSDRTMPTANMGSHHHCLHLLTMIPKSSDHIKKSRFNCKQNLTV